MALAAARTATTASMTPKYSSIRPARWASKPLSIMRRTAIGTASVASAATTRATTAAATRPR